MNSKELAEFYDSRENRPTFCIKQEVAREIFEKVEYYLNKYFEGDYSYRWLDLIKDLANLKNKYIGE